MIKVNDTRLDSISKVLKQQFTKYNNILTQHTLLCIFLNTIAAVRANSVEGSYVALQSCRSVVALHSDATRVESGNSQ